LINAGLKLLAFKIELPYKCCTIKKQKIPKTLYFNVIGIKIVESAGVEPASKQAIKKLSTSLVFN
jgi:hypothetical protein